MNYVHSLNVQKYCRIGILCTSTYVLHILEKCVFSIPDTNVLCSFNFKPQSTKVNGRIYFKNDTEDRIFTVFKNSVWLKVMDKTNQIYSSNEIRKAQNEHLMIVCQIVCSCPFLDFFGFIQLIIFEKKLFQFWREIWIWVVL